MQDPGAPASLSSLDKRQPDTPERSGGKDVAGNSLALAAAGVSGGGGGQATQAQQHPLVQQVSEIDSFSARLEGILHTNVMQVGHIASAAHTTSWWRHAVHVIQCRWL